MEKIGERERERERVILNEWRRGKRQVQQERKTQYVKQKNIVMEKWERERARQGERLLDIEIDL